MRSPYVRGAAWLLLGVLLFWTAACATLRGMGEDIQSLGGGIKKVFSP